MTDIVLARPTPSQTAATQLRADAALRRHALQLVLRVALVLVVIVAAPVIFKADVGYYWQHASGLSLHHLPYRGFFWEYPPVAAAPLLLIPLTGGSLFWFVVLFPVSMALLEYGSLVALEHTWPDRARAIRRWWNLLGLPLCAIAWFRLDFVAVLPATVFLASLERDRSSVRPLVLGIGAKLWPGVLAVAFVARREWRQLRAAVLSTAIALATWYCFSPDGVRSFLAFRRGAGVQVESTIGAVVRLTGARPAWVSNTWVVGGNHWGWVDAVGMMATGIGALVLALGVTRWRVRDDRIVEFLGACVVATLLGSRLFSPQFMVWLLPFVALTAARGGRREAALFGLAVVCTVTTMFTYAGLLVGSPLWALIPMARNAALAVLGWSMLHACLSTKSDGTLRPTATPV